MNSHSESQIQELVDNLQELNDIAEFQKRSFSQISLAVNLGDTCLAELFTHEVNYEEDTCRHHAKIKLKNKTGSTFYQDFWRLIFNTCSPGNENKNSYNCWSLNKPWKNGEMLEFRFHIDPLHQRPVTISCSLLFVVPSSYVAGTHGSALAAPASRTGDTAHGLKCDRTAVLALPLFSSTLDALHALEPRTSVSRGPPPATVPGWAAALLPPAAEPVPAPPLELGVSVPQSVSAAGWLAAALRDSRCWPDEDDPLAVEARLWGCPVRLAASEPAGAALLTVSCDRLAPLLRLLRALRRRLPPPPPGQAVRVPSHVLSRLQGLLERVRAWSDGDPSRLLELWLAAQQSVCHRLPHV